MAEKREKELGGARKMSTGTKVVVGIFAVIMALSMMLPSLTAIFARDDADTTQEQADAQTDDTDSSEDADATDDEASDKDADADESDAQDEDKDEDASDEADDPEAGVPDNETLQNLASQNADAVKLYQGRLAEDPKNLAALLNLGQTYMNWGYSATYSATTDEEKTYAEGLVNKAVGYFDRYLKLRDSASVEVDKALCSYYLGKNDEAIAALEKVGETYPDNPLVWANLGMLYESQYNNDKATEAYQKAVDTDPDDEYGAKSYASQRLISINSTVSNPGDAGDASADDVSTAANSGLTPTLKNDAGVGF